MTENEKEEAAIKSERNLKVKQRERLVRKGRIKKERLRIFTGFLLTVGLIYGIYFFSTCRGWYMDKNAFNYVGGNSVEIINNKIVPSYKILSALRNSEVPEHPLYLAKTNDIKTNIMKLEPVENVYIRRFAFPARVQIIIRERQPVLTISPDFNIAPVAFFTQDGKLIGREYLPLGKNFKTILALTYGNKGDDYRKWNKAKVDEIQKIVQHVETYSKEPVEYIDLRNPQDIFVKIPSINIRLGKPDTAIYERIARIPSVLGEVKSVDSKIKYLDLSWEKVNYLKLE